MGLLLRRLMDGAGHMMDIITMITEASLGLHMGKN